VAVIGNVELIVGFGNYVKVQLPVAASQTLKLGEPFYLNSGKVTRVAATTEAIDTGDDMLGWVAQNCFTQIGTTVTSLAVDTLVNCIMWTRNIFWNMPTYNGTPAVTNLTTSYAGYQDAGVYKLDIGNTTNPVFKPFAFDMTDAADGIDASFKQVAF
jgi:hypothetical protein